MVFGLLFLLSSVTAFGENDDLQFLEIEAALGAVPLEGSFFESESDSIQTEPPDETDSFSEFSIAPEPQSPTAQLSTGEVLPPSGSTEQQATVPVPETTPLLRTSAPSPSSPSSANPSVDETLPESPNESTPASPWPPTASTEPQSPEVTPRATANEGTESKDPNAADSEPALNGGAVTGIVVGVLVFAAAVSGIVYYFVRKKGDAESSSSSESSNFSSSESEQDAI
jgi:hypothetical protein